MKAIGYRRSLPITDPESLIEVELPQPLARGRDLLVKVKAIAVNPVDYKIRRNVTPAEGELKVLGWDAVGEVVTCGDQVRRFKRGDAVFYAGDLNRQGCNAEYQLVDERLVGHKPSSLSDAEAAALPLTAITAWELLFEHLALQHRPPESDERSEEVLLVVGAAGGVGSILIQLTRTLTGARVIATASRPTSSDWVKQLGADFVVDHSQPLTPQLDALADRHDIGPVTHIASLNHTEAYFDAYIELLPPFGRIAMIDDPVRPLDVMLLKPKSLSLHLEFMFARSMFQARDMIEQSRLLERISALVDEGLIRSTVGAHLGRITVDNLKLAHAELESGRAVGKIVLEGF